MGAGHRWTVLRHDPHRRFALLFKAIFLVSGWLAIGISTVIRYEGDSMVSIRANTVRHCRMSFLACGYDLINL